MHYYKSVSNNAIHDKLPGDICRSWKGDAQGIQVHTGTADKAPPKPTWLSQVWNHATSSCNLGSKQKCTFTYELCHNKATWRLFSLLGMFQLWTSSWCTGQTRCQAFQQADCPTACSSKEQQVLVYLCWREAATLRAGNPPYNTVPQTGCKTISIFLKVLLVKSPSIKKRKKKDKNKTCSYNSHIFWSPVLYKY